MTKKLKPHSAHIIHLLMEKPYENAIAKPHSIKQHNYDIVRGVLFWFRLVTKRLRNKYLDIIVKASRAVWV